MPRIPFFCLWPTAAALLSSASLLITFLFAAVSLMRGACLCCGATGAALPRASNDAVGGPARRKAFSGRGAGMKTLK